MTGTWARPWTPAPMSATWTPAAAGGPKWRIATPLIAAVRWAVIGPASRIAVGTPVSGSLRTTTAAIDGSPRLEFSGEPATHFMPTRSPVTLSPRRWAGIAWANELSGLGWTPILAGSSLAPGRARAVMVSSASRSRSATGGIEARTSSALNQRRGGSAPGSVAVDRPDIGGHCTEGGSALGGAAADRYDSLDGADRHRPEPREPEARTRCHRALRRAGANREGPAPRRGLPHHRRQRAPPRRCLGRQAPRARRDGARAGRAAPAHPDDRAHRAPVRDACGPRPRPGARGRRGGD